MRGPPGVTPYPKTGEDDALFQFILGALRMPAITIEQAVARIVARHPLTSRHGDVLRGRALGKDCEGGAGREFP